MATITTDWKQIAPKGTPDSLVRRYDEGSSMGMGPEFPAQGKAQGAHMGSQSTPPSKESE